MTSTLEHSKHYIPDHQINYSPIKSEIQLMKLNGNTSNFLSKKIYLPALSIETMNALFFMWKLFGKLINEILVLPMNKH